MRFCPAFSATPWFSSGVGCMNAEMSQIVKRMLEFLQSRVLHRRRFRPKFSRAFRPRAARLHRWTPWSGRPWSQALVIPFLCSLISSVLTSNEHHGRCLPLGKFMCQRPFLARTICARYLSRAIYHSWCELHMIWFRNSLSQFSRRRFPFRSHWHIFTVSTRWLYERLWPALCSRPLHGHLSHRIRSEIRSKSLQCHANLCGTKQYETVHHFTPHRWMIYSIIGWVSIKAGAFPLPRFALQGRASSLPHVWFIPPNWVAASGNSQEDSHRAPPSAHQSRQSVWTNDVHRSREHRI
jgi:hypothetical protein